MLEKPGQEIQYFEDDRYTGELSSGRQIAYTDDYKSLPLCLSYPLSFVDQIGVIEGASTVLWGPGLAKNGIISITLKHGEDLDNAISKTPSTEIGLTSPLGYQTPAEFYAPAYATEKARRSMVPDYRTTLYWNPTVKLDDTGQATVEFYTSDAPADYDISIEGVTQTGKIVQRRQRLLPE